VILVLFGGIVVISECGFGSAICWRKKGKVFFFLPELVIHNICFA